MVLLIFPLDLFFNEKLILLYFFSKIKHRVFIIILLLENFVRQWNKWFLRFSDILTVMPFGLEFLTFFQIPMRRIPFRLIFLKRSLNVFEIRLVGLFVFLLKSGQKTDVIEWWVLWVGLMEDNFFKRLIMIFFRAAELKIGELLFEWWRL